MSYCSLDEVEGAGADGAREARGPRLSGGGGIVCRITWAVIAVVVGCPGNGPGKLVAVRAHLSVDESGV